MQVPLYFINSKELKTIDEAAEIYNYISSLSHKIVTEEEYLDIREKLKRRQFLESYQLFKILSILVLIVVSSEVIENTYSIDILETKYTIAKLLSTHFKKLSDEELVDNMSLLQHMHDVIQDSTLEMMLNKEEKNIVYYLKLLTI